jgi:hypothetical protein
VTRRYKILTTHEQAEINQRYPRESSTILARAYGCTPPTIRAAVLRAGGTIQPPRNRRTATPVPIEPAHTDSP